MVCIIGMMALLCIAEAAFDAACAVARGIVRRRRWRTHTRPGARACTARGHFNARVRRAGI